MSRHSKWAGARKRYSRIGELFVAGQSVDEITVELKADLGEDHPAAQREVVCSAVAALTAPAEEVPA